MRITQSMIQNQIQNAEQTSVAANKFAKGQQLKAVVLNAVDGLALLNIGGDVVQAKNLGSKALLPGQQILVTAMGMEGDTVVVKLVDGDAAQTNGLNQQLSAQLKAMGVDDSKKNVAILKTMHEQSVPISIETLSGIKRDTAAIDQLSKQINDGAAPKIEWQASAKQNIVTMQLSGEQSALRADKQQSQAASTANFAGGADAKVVNSILQDAKASDNNQRQAMGKIYGELNHLNTQLSSKLIALAENGDKLQQTVAFMHKHNIPNSALNTVLSSQLLSGKTGVMSSVLDILSDSKDILPDALKKITEKLSVLTPKFNKMSESLDGEKLKELVKEGLALQKTLSETQFLSKTGEKAEHMAVAKQTQSLFAETPIAWQNIQIPVQLQNEIEDIDIYIKGDDSRGGKINPDDGLIYIALNTNNMDTVKIKLGFKKERIQIDFITQSQTISDYMAHHTKDLVDDIKQLTTKEVVVYFNDGKDDVNIAQLDKVDLKSITAFDMRV